MKCLMVLNKIVRLTISTIITNYDKVQKIEQAGMEIDQLLLEWKMVYDRETHYQPMCLINTRDHHQKI